ncbi:MAG TPA: epoxide hydrolase [Pseudomonadales bacterium]|nr:epoxide hydrolase [Pseudomonadales bacterium]
MNDAVTPFRIDVPQSDLDDLTARLARTRWPDADTTGGATVGDWNQGMPLAYAQEVAEYWRTAYDWRRAETLLNAFPQFTTPLDGPGGTLDIHFIHVRSKHADAMPLLITHGWPGSVLEFHKVIGPLTDPEAHGGDASDAFHVICPSLPGFAFSAKPTVTGWGIPTIATAWHQLMGRLGYDRYVAQGGDWGSAVTTQLGVHAPEGLLGIHVNMPITRPDPDTMDDLTELEKSALAGFKYYADWDSGYSKEQSTRPQTIGYGLADSPVGQMTWILEKFHRWMDCDGHPEHVLSRDELLDNVMLYWLNDAGASSARLYWESFASGSQDPVTVPAGCSLFPKEIFLASKRWFEKRYTNVIHWREHAKGGHFAAIEVPEVYVAEVRDCFRQLR